MARRNLLELTPAFLPRSFQGLLVALLLACTAASPQPLYYGWFFNEEIAASLQEITSNHLKYLYTNNSIFHNFLDRQATQAGISSALQYYTKPTDPNTGNYDPFFHITAHYCGTEDCSAYTTLVQEYLGRNFSTELIGVFMTPRTYGIRVNLSEEQLSIFTDGSRSLKYFNGQQTALDSETVSGEHYSSEYPGIEFVDQDPTNFHPTTSRAHVTLGCAPNVSAVTTGTDLLEIISLERVPGAFCTRFPQDNGGILIRMGAECDIFVYYLNQKMIANAEFQVYYGNHSYMLRPLSVLTYATYVVASLYTILLFNKATINDVL